MNVDKIVKKHAKKAHAEIEAEAAKSKAQREAENEAASLAPEVQALSQSLDDMYKSPQRWRAEIEQAEKSLELKVARLQELGGMAADKVYTGITNQTHHMNPSTGKSLSPYPETSEQAVNEN